MSPHPQPSEQHAASCGCDQCCLDRMEATLRHLVERVEQVGGAVAEVLAEVKRRGVPLA